MSIRCLLLIMVLLLTAAAKASPSGDGTLVLGITGDCTSFNPYLTSDPVSWRVAALLHDTLLEYDDTLTSRGRLAESWNVSTDRKSWSFKLRKGIRFHDGVELTSADVEYTLAMLRDSRLRVARSTLAEDMGSGTRFQTIDARSFRVSFEHPSASALEDWASLPILPRHRAQGVSPAAWSTNAIGSGPFRLVEAVRGERIVLAAFDGYFGGRPRLDRVVFQVEPDDARRLVRFRRGELDSLSLSAGRLPALAGEALFESHRLFSFLEPAYTYIGWQCEPERTRLFADPRMRRAMAHAIDSHRLVRELLAGQAEVATSAFDRAGWGRAAAPRESVFNPALARELLGKAGWFDTDGDGILDRGSERLSFFLDAPAGSDSVQRQVELIAEGLRHAGVEARPRFTDWDSFLSERVQKREFEAIYLAWHLPVTPDARALFHSSAVPSPSNPRGLNRIGFASVAADEALDAIRAAADPAERRVACDLFDRLLEEEAPVAMLYRPRRYELVARRVRIERAGAREGFDASLKLAVTEVSRLGLWTSETLCQSWVDAPQVRAERTPGVINK